MALILAALVCATLVVSVRRHGRVSFVTLGVVGAAIYAIPGIVDMERSFELHARAVFHPTRDAADAVVVVAWCGLLAGVALFSSRSNDTGPTERASERSTMRRLAMAAAIFGGLGLLYLIYTQGSQILISSRYDQHTDQVLLIWRWTAPTGLIASVLCKSRKLFWLNLATLFVIFLRGDRTMVAITMAGMLVAMMQSGPWLRQLRLKHLLGIATAILVVLLGKSVYLALKAWLGGEGELRTRVSIIDQIYYQFEPFATYAHVGYVMRRGLEIPISDFFQSLFANLLIVPSAFGLSTNIYGEMIQRTQRIGSGLAGNYIANGYAVGGAVGAALFYFLLIWILRTCDIRFRRTSGAWKLFWACTGAVFAFYVQRNGLDNMLSLVRQIVIVCILLAAGAVALSSNDGALRRPSAAKLPRQPRKFTSTR